MPRQKMTPEEKASRRAAREAEKKIVEGKLKKKITELGYAVDHLDDTRWYLEDISDEVHVCDLAWMAWVGKNTRTNRELIRDGFPPNGMLTMVSRLKMTTCLSNPVEVIEIEDDVVMVVIATKKTAAPGAQVEGMK